MLLKPTVLESDPTRPLPGSTPHLKSSLLTYYGVRDYLVLRSEEFMRFTNQATDLAVLSEIGERLGRLRLNRNLTQAALAAEAGVSKSTIERLEKGESVQLTSFVRVLRALDLAEKLDLLVPEPSLSPMARLESQGKERQRASPPSRPNDPEEEGSAETWTWGE